MAAYYNEIDPYAAQWLRNLIAVGHIAPGDVDERSIVDVQPDDLRGYGQCHFFAGIGGWSYALRLAGWADDRPVWTGSCPCQPFSSAARGRNSRRQDIEKHLWPHWRRLIAARRPVTLFGEQVAQAGDWFDEVCDDLEAMDYASGAAILTALGVGHDHARPRIYYLGNANRNGEPVVCVDGEVARLPRSRGFSAGMVSPDGLPGRMAQLGAFGNAIVPQVAAEFIGAFLDMKRAA